MGARKSGTAAVYWVSIDRAPTNEKNMNTQILGRALSRASDHGRRLVEHAHLPLALFPLQPPFLKNGDGPSFIFRDRIDDERRELLAAELAPARSIAVARRGPTPPRAASPASGSAPTMSTRRWRRGRPQDRVRPLQHLRSPRTHRGPLGPADDPGIGSKIKKKTPTSIIPGDAGTHHRAVQRNRLRCTTSTSGVDHKPIEEVASTLFLQRGQRQESVFESVSSLENDWRQLARS